MKENDSITNDCINDAILGRPFCFRLGGRFFYLHQPSIGISLLSAEILQEMGIPTDCFNFEMVAIGLAHEKRELFLRFIAIHLFSHRQDALFEGKVQSAMQSISELKDAELASLFLVIIGWGGWKERMFKHFNLDKDAKQRKKISEAKDKDGGTIMFGGHSIFGSIIDYAAERYGWSVEYILWGVSALTLNMLMNDAITSTYLTKEEKKKARVSTDGIVIKADDPNNNDYIRTLFGK